MLHAIYSVQFSLISEPTILQGLDMDMGSSKSRNETKPETEGNETGSAFLLIFNQ